MDRHRQTAMMIAAGAVVLALSFGARSTFGVVLDPMSREFAWPREVFSLSLAIQNLVWGFAQPVFGAIADRMGDRRALWIGFGFYLAGMVLTATGTAPWMMHLGAGLLVGGRPVGTHRLPQSAPVQREPGRPHPVGPPLEQLVARHAPAEVVAGRGDVAVQGHVHAEGQCPHGVSLP